MKPRNKVEREIVSLSTTLKPITEAKISWGFDKVLEKSAYCTKSKINCTECGHSWDNTGQASKKCTCPECGKVLTCLFTQKKKGTQTGYFSVLEAIGNIQVLRIVWVIKHEKVGSPAVNISLEVVRNFITEKGQLFSIQRASTTNGYYYDSWIFGSDLELRDHNSSQRINMKAFLHVYHTYPKKEITPLLRRNGFTGRFYDCCPTKFIMLLASDNRFETLLKVKQIGLLKYYTRHKIVANWNSILTCIKNNYIVKDASMFIDYLFLLEYFKKDLRSPKYICVDSIKKEHDRLLEKRRAIQNREIELKKLKKITEYESQYQEEKSHFFGLLFQDGDLVIQPLKTVEEVANEGEVLKHCIYYNDYYKKKDSLLLSARIGEKPIETIELSLQDYSILQSRGRFNQETEYTAKIKQVIENNISQIITLNQC